MGGSGGFLQWLFRRIYVKGSPHSHRQTPMLGIKFCTTRHGKDVSSHAFSMHESTGTERDDNLIVPSGLKKETISERRGLER